MIQRLIAEFIGTLAIVYCGVGAIALTETGLLNGGLFAIAVGHGFAVIIMIYAVGNVSGAHFNPAITIALSLTKRFSWTDALPYIGAQLLGSLSAVAILSLTHGAALEKVKYGATLLAPTVSPLAGFAIELLLTFFLAFIIFRVAVLQNHPAAGAMIGATVMMCIVAAGPLTGVALNPARAFGPAIFGHWENHWIMWVAPILGATLGAFTAQALESSKSKE
jgi:MIP family channel proteins